MANKSEYDKWVENNELSTKLVLIQGWAREGLIDEQIAANLGIVRKTLSEYKKKYPDVAKALKTGKEVTDFMVENALFKQAASGNVTAAIYWLNNRKPNKWSNQQREYDNGNNEDNSFIEALDNKAGEIWNEK
ncbi:MAG: transposase [Clostridia bacterium]